MLSLPAVFSGWMNDDYFFDTPLYETDAPFGYYRFMERFEEARLQPWWVSPEYKLRFLRPLASLTLHLDFTLFGDAPLAAHLHSLLWSLVLLLGACSLLRKVLPRRESRFAMVIFTFAVCHAWGAGWIAARHAVLGGALSSWSAVFYLHWRMDKSPHAGAISLVLFVLGLAAGEMALALVPFLFCYELAGASGSWRVRLTALAPVTAIALIYAVVYVAFGYGAGGSGAYLDPVHQTAEYLAGIVPKTAAVIGSFGFGVPAIMRVIPGAEAIPIAAGVLGSVLLLVGYLFSRSRLEPAQHRVFLWSVLAVILPLLPGLAGIAQGREFVLSAIAFAAAVAVVLRALLATRGAWYRRIVPFIVAGFLILGLFVLCPVSRLGQSAFIHISSELMVAAGQGSKVRCPDGATVYVINGDFMRAVGFPFAVARYQGFTFPGWQQLVTPESDIEVTRTAADRIVVKSTDKPLVNDFLHLYRPANQPHQAGDVAEVEGMRVDVITAGEAGPTEIAFTIPALAESVGTCFLRYDKEILHNWTPPAVGTSETIPFVPPLPMD